MDWQAGSDPAKFKDFETQARIKRYRLLAQAALASNVTDLLTGHHQDDQVETVLLRMILRQRPPLPAFLGMAPSCNIPSCTDVDGANGRGPRLYIRGHHTAPEDPFEQQGISILRPFLEFPKERLVATCLQERINFVSDLTNFDPTITPRNAVRHLRSKYKLPNALGTASILHLHQVANSRINAIRDRAMQLFEARSPWNFDLRAGTVAVELSGTDMEKLQQDQEAASFLLAKIIAAVSPFEPSRHSVLLGPALTRTLLGVHHNTDVHSQPKQWAKLSTNLVILETETIPAEVPGHGPSHIWRFYRAPMRPSEIENAHVVLEDGPESWSKRVLWDNRFWIRIRPQAGFSASSFRLRNLIPADMTSIRELMNPSQRKAFDEELHVAAPGTIRYAVPVLCDAKTDQALALPTFNIRFATKHSRFASLSYDPGNVQWEVHFKSIPNDLRNSICFVRPRRAP